MALVAIGPVAISHGDPAFSSSASPTGHGIESLSIGGSCSWAASDTLRELVKNPADLRIVAGHEGVLAWLVFDDDLLGAITGYYLLEGFSRDADHRSSLTTTDVSFSLTAAYLGDLA